MKIKQNEYYPQSVLHPGIDLVEKLEELKMSPIDFAIKTSIPEKTITDIIKGNISITAVMAERFENVLHIPFHYWLNRQLSYDEYKFRDKQ